MLNGLGGDWLGTKISVASLDSLVLVNRIQGIQDTECVYSVYAATKQTKSSTQLLAWYFRGSHSTILVFSNCLLSRPPSGSSRWNGVYFRRVRRGEVHWVHVHPPPPPPPTWEKSSAQKCPKEERKFRPDISAKKKCARSAQIRQNENEKGREK